MATRINPGKVKISVKITVRNDAPYQSDQVTYKIISTHLFVKKGYTLFTITNKLNKKFFGRVIAIHKIRQSTSRSWFI